MEATEVAKRFAGFYFGVLSSGNASEARRLYSEESVRSELRGCGRGEVGEGDGVEGVQAEGAEAIQELINGLVIREGMREPPLHFSVLSRPPC